MQRPIDQNLHRGGLVGDLRSVYLLTPGGQSAPGGIAKIVDYEVRYWPTDSGYRLKVLDTFGPGPRWKMPLFFLAAAATLLLHLMMGKVTLVHLNMAERLSVWRKLTLAFIAQMFSVPVVIHLHGAEFRASYAKSNCLVAFFVRWRLCKCAAVMCLGSATEDYLIQHLGLSAARVSVVPNGVPDFGCPTDKCETSCRFVFVGALAQRKGITTLIEALAQPQLAVSSSWEATIVGGGDVDQQRGYAESLGIGNRISFVGAVDEATVHAHLRVAHVCVLPSRSEGLPLAILEAMSFGCAIVATPVGDVPEAVVPSLTGILTPVGDVNALAKALFRLTSDIMYCTQLGQGARRYFEARFSIQHHCSKIKDVYDRCLLMAPDHSVSVKRGSVR